MPNESGIGIDFFLVFGVKDQFGKIKDLWILVLWMDGGYGNI